MAKKFTAIILTLAMLLSAFAVPASAATEVTSEFERGFYRFVDGLLDAVVTGISYMIVEPRGWATMDTYESKNFYETFGTRFFLHKRNKYQRSKPKIR